MAIDYTDVATVKAELGIDDNDSDGLIQIAVSAASRWIDKYCGTTFYPVTEARTFEAACDGTVEIDAFTDTTGLVVKTGTDGTYPTTIAGTAYVLQPLNAPNRGGAYNRIVIPNGGIPASHGFPTVQITAAWGYSEVPDDVAEAALIRAAQIFRRKGSPEVLAGVLGETVSRLQEDDPTIRGLLAPYKDPGIA